MPALRSHHSGSLPHEPRHGSIVTTKHGDVFRHPSTACGNTMRAMREGQPLRAFCCGRWVTPPKETFFTKLPRKQAQPIEMR